MNDGTVQRFTAEQRANLAINDASGQLPSGAKGMYHTHWAEPGTRYFVNDRGNIISDDPADYYEGERVKGQYETTVRYHSPADLANQSNSIVLNRYDGSYYPGPGLPNTDYSVYRTISPPINRFVYSFLFWR